MFYAYTTILGKSEDEFWGATPRRIFKQIDIHKEVNKPKNNKSKNGVNEVSGEVTRLKVLD